MSKFFGMILILFLASCSSEHDPSLIEDLSGAESQVNVLALLEMPGDIVFSDVYNAVLSPSCVSCHGGGKLTEAKVDLTSFENASGIEPFRKTFAPGQPDQSMLYQTLIIPSGSRHMPPLKKPQLSKDQINLVYQWVLNGAKRVKTQRVERPKSLSEIFAPYFAEPQTIDYALIKEHVFDNSCTKCHSKDSPLKDTGALTYGQDMTTYQSLFKDEKNIFSKAGINKGRLTDKFSKDADGNIRKDEGSRIYRAAAISQTMPPSKKGYIPMDSLRVKLLRLWILNCAIEDYESIKDNDDLDEKEVEKRNDKVRRCSGL